MIEVKAPFVPDMIIRLFLAGSIEMDTAERWQDRVVEALKDEQVQYYYAVYQ